MRIARIGKQATVLALCLAAVGTGLSCAEGGPCGSTAPWAKLESCPVGTVRVENTDCFICCIPTGNGCAAGGNPCCSQVCGASGTCEPGPVGGQCLSGSGADCKTGSCNLAGGTGPSIFDQCNYKPCSTTSDCAAGQTCAGESQMLANVDGKNPSELLASDAGACIGLTGSACGQDLDCASGVCNGGSCACSPSGLPPCL